MDEFSCRAVPVLQPLGVRGDPEIACAWLLDHVVEHVVGDRIRIRGIAGDAGKGIPGFVVIRQAKIRERPDGAGAVLVYLYDDVIGQTTGIFGVMTIMPERSGSGIKAVKSEYWWMFY